MHYKKGEKREYINGRKLMWMMVMFDLPTDTSEQRREASKFRNFLLDIGFSMTQYSVYTQFVGTWDSSKKYIGLVREAVPDWGDVNILFFTDKQFENIIHIENCIPASKKNKKLDQFELF